MPTRVSLQHTVGVGLDILLRARQAEAEARLARPESSGLVVRMAMPPRLKLSVRAAAMVLPKR